MSKPCLPVSRRRKNRNEDSGSNDVSFDDIQSLDASEYMSRVVEQAQRMPEVLLPREPDETSMTKRHKRRCLDDHVPIDGSAASSSYLASDRTSLQPPPTEQHLPLENPQEWVDQTLANFSQLRQYLERVHRQGRLQHDRSRVPVPTMKDRPGWHIFCVGKTEARGNAGNYFADDDEEEEEEEEVGNGDDTSDNSNTSALVENEHKNQSDPAQAWPQHVPETGYHPTTTLLLQLDQVMVRRVIAHLSHYLDGGWDAGSAQRTLWLYALLARLEKPIHRNDAAVLYSILKTLTRAREALQPTQRNRRSLARINVLITVIGVYFALGGGYNGVMVVK